MDKMIPETRDNSLTENITYNINGKTFIVEPKFHTEGTETLGDILLKLMKAERISQGG